jgi:hypothetical protein
MNLLEIYASAVLSAEKNILIPQPPGTNERIKELKAVKNQYYNRYNPESIQDQLDKVKDSFDLLLNSYGIFNEKKLINLLSERIIPFIKEHKNYYNALRPNELAEKNNIIFEFDYLSSANSPSYPSGHAAQAYYIALKLSLLHPDLKDELIELANMISQARIDRAVHFKSDIDAGKLLALKVFRQEKIKNGNK